MPHHPDRPRSGARRWLAEIALRLAGLALLGGAYALGRLAGRAMEPGGSGEPGLVAAGLCGLAFVALVAGLALATHGTRLFGRVPAPQRPWT